MATILSKLSEFQLATAIATNAQAPAKANSLIFRFQVMARLMIPAITIIMIAHEAPEIPNPFQFILVSQAEKLAISATVIQPEYKQNGHHTKAILRSGKSSNSILVA